MKTSHPPHTRRLPPGGVPVCRARGGARGRFAAWALVAASLLPAPAIAGGGDGEFHSALQDELYLEFKGFHGFSVREFNRIDGFTPSFRMSIRSAEEGRYPSIGLTGLYSIERRRPLWDFSIEKSFLDAPGVVVRFEAFRLTETNDRWRMSDLENSIAGFLFREDFRDYYEEQGIRIGIRMEPGFFHRFTVTYADRSIRPVGANDPFTLFGRGKSFRRNPPVDAGIDRSLVVAWRYDSRDNIRAPRRGWLNDLAVETAPSGFGGAFAYRVVTAHLRRYNVVFGRHALNFRLSLGRSGGAPPPHRRFSLGGVGTLSGLPDLSERGTDYLLGNVEYRFPIRGIDWKPFRMVFGELQALVFFDAGDAWTGPWRASGMRADAGAGISGANIFSYFGLYVARAVDGTGTRPRITVRMQRDF